MQTPCLLPSNTAKVNYHSPEQLLFQLPSLASFHLPFLNISLSSHASNVTSGGDIESCSQSPGPTTPPILETKSS
jgi:hypothetical protein